MFEEGQTRRGLNEQKLKQVDIEGTHGRFLPIKLFNQEEVSPGIAKKVDKELLNYYNV